MNHIRIYLFAILSGSFFITACEQDSIGSTVTETAVVTGYLFAGQACDSIRITQSISYGSVDSLAIPLNDLSVSVSDGSSDFSLTPIGEGYYQNTDLIIQSGETYTLEFEHKNETVSASTFIPWKREAAISDTLIKMEKVSAGSPPQIGGGGDPGEDAIEITWDNPEGDYFYVVVQNIEDDPEYINEFFAELDPDFANFRFISEPQASDYYNIDPNREIRQFGTHRVIVFRVNPEYAALYNVSDASSLSITEPPSNVVNGLGILTGVASDTLYFEVEEE